MSIFVAYDRSHCSVFVTFLNETAAITLISPEKLRATNSLNSKINKTLVFPISQILIFFQLKGEFDDQ